MDIRCSYKGSKKEMTGEKSVYFDNFIIETPKGKKVTVLAVNAYVPDHRRDGIMAEARRDERWYGQFIDIAAEINECGLFIDVGFSPAKFLKALKEKGFKVYWKS